MDHIVNPQREGQPRKQRGSSLALAALVRFADQLSIDIQPHEKAFSLLPLYHGVDWQLGQKWMPSGLWPRWVPAAGTLDSVPQNPGCLISIVCRVLVLE